MARTKQTARESSSRKQLARLKDIRGRKNNGKVINTGNANTNAEECENKENEDSSPVERFTNLLSDIKDEPGSFATNGVLKQSPLPGLNIQGVGPICLPLCPDTAKRIINIACQAPYGLGEKTLVDEKVRKSWEIDPERITLNNPRFQSTLKTLVLRVQQELGCGNDNIRADLYKLLLYEEGGHFKPHRDSEKENGMFATLIVQLPSVFSGNQLIVRHSGKTHTVDFDSEDAEFSILYAAHYADCEHEVTPLFEGYRLALIYNLVWTAPSLPPSIKQSVKTIQKLSSLLKEVEREHNSVFGWTLEHQYSSSSLANGIAALKGKDRLIAKSLCVASEDMNSYEQMSFYLVKLERHLNESGEGCGGGGYGRHRGWNRYDSDSDEFDPDDFEPCDVIDDITVVKEAFDFDGDKHDIQNISFDVEEDLFDLESKFEGDVDTFWGDHDSEDVEGPTGNTGGSRDRWYSNYIILAIPESQQFKLLCKCGINECLRHLYGEFESSSPKFKEHFRTFLTTFSASLYTEERRSSSYSREPENANKQKAPAGEKIIVKVMRMLETTRDADLVNLFIKNVINGKKSSYSYQNNSEIFGLYHENTERPLAMLLKSVSWNSIKQAVESVIEQCPLKQYHQWMLVYNHSGITDIAHKTIQLSLQKVEQLNGKDNFSLWVQIFDQMLCNDEFGARWWDSITSCTHIISNLPLLAHLCCKLSPEKQTKFSCLLNTIGHILKQPCNTLFIDAIASDLFLAMNQIIHNQSYKKELQELCNILVESNKLPVIGLLLGLLLNKDQNSCTDSEAFKMFLTAYMSWMDNSNLDESNLKEIVNVANVVYQNRTIAGERSSQYISSCKKIRNVDLLCMVINQLFSIFKEKKVSDHSTILKSLLESLLNLVTLQPLRNAKSMSTLILLIFGEGDPFDDFLCKFIATKYVSNSIETLGNVLSSLCATVNKETFKSNNNFQALLGLYALLLQNGVKPDLNSYSATLAFLFSDETWSLSVPLLPILLEIDFITKEFKNCAFSISQIPSGTASDNFKKLLNTGVDSLELFLVQNKTASDPDYNVILQFVQVFFNDLTNFGDIVSRLISIAQLKTNDHSSMYAKSSVLKRLINDLQSKHHSTEPYAKLLLIRATNLRTLQVSGQPKLNWSQPNATIIGHPTVQDFLRSNRESFSYTNFNNIAHARNWVRKHEGFFPTKGYGFRAAAHGAGRAATAQLRKGREFYSLRLKAYNTLMLELDQLRSKLKAFPNIHSELGENKRPASTPLSNISNMPPPKKIHVIQID